MRLRKEAFEFAGEAVEGAGAQALDSVIVCEKLLGALSVAPALRITKSLSQNCYAEWSEASWESEILRSAQNDILGDRTLGMGSKVGIRSVRKKSC